MKKNSENEKKIASLISEMTLEEKVLRMFPSENRNICKIKRFYNKASGCAIPFGKKHPLFSSFGLT